MDRRLRAAVNSSVCWSAPGVVSLRATMSNVSSVAAITEYCRLGRTVDDLFRECLELIVGGGPSEAGDRAAGEPAERPTVPSPASPDEPEGAARARPLPEGAPAPPSHWPETVPWPPAIMVPSENR